MQQLMGYLNHGCLMNPGPRPWQLSLLSSLSFWLFGSHSLASPLSASSPGWRSWFSKQLWNRDSILVLLLNVVSPPITACNKACPQPSLLSSPSHRQISYLLRVRFLHCHGSESESTAINFRFTMSCILYSVKTIHLIAPSKISITGLQTVRSPRHLSRPKFISNFKSIFAWKFSPYF